jgi:hypothetical protein
VNQLLQKLQLVKEHTNTSRRSSVMLGNDNYYERFTGLWWSSLGGKVGKYVSIKAANFKVVSIYYFFCLTVDKTFFDW